MDASPFGADCDMVVVCQVVRDSSSNGCDNYSAQALSTTKVCLRVFLVVVGVTLPDTRCQRSGRQVASAVYESGK